MSVLRIDWTRKLMITGGRHTSQELSYLARLIGHETILSDCRLLSNGADGVDSASAEGALMACLLNELDPLKWIKVFRPINDPKPAFDFGHLRIAGDDYDERRDFVISHSDAVIVIGGGSGTGKVVERVRAYDKPLVPIGIGSSNEASVIAWNEWSRVVEADKNSASLLNDLMRIGPGQYDLRSAAKEAVALCQRLLDQA